MADRVCLPILHFTLLIVSFVACVIWGLHNLFQFTQCQNKQSSQTNSLLNYFPSIFGGMGSPIGGIGNPMGNPIGNHMARPDPDTMDDLMVGNLPPARRDYRVLDDPLKEASRRYTTHPTGGPVGNLAPLGHVGGMFNVPTQGYYPSYQMMGFLSKENDPDRMLKLFGRRIDKYRYEYYTANHNDPQLKIPIRNKGDKELMEGDEINVPGFGKHDFHVNLYDYEAPRYLPTVF